MLNKRENAVMNAVYTLCNGNGMCLVSPAELLDSVTHKIRCNEEQLETLLRALALDEYFELLSSERKGEKMYVISLRTNGYAYKRNTTQIKRDLALKIGWAVVSAIIAFVVGMILKWIF
jgi:hypothetical protein